MIEYMKTQHEFINLTRDVSFKEEMKNLSYMLGRSCPQLMTCGFQRLENGNDRLLDLMSVMLHILDFVYKNTVHYTYTIPNYDVLSYDGFYWKLDSWIKQINNGDLYALEELYQELLGQKKQKTLLLPRSY